MAIPKFDEFFQPVLQYINNTQETVTRKELLEAGKTLLEFTDEEIHETISSGKSRIEDRVHWAILYLRQAELIESVNKGVYRITDIGKEYLENNASFKLGDLKTIPALQDWLYKSNNNKKQRLLADDIENQNTYNNSIEQDNNRDIVVETENYYESVESDILDRLKNLGIHSVDKGTKFEDICLDLLEKMGYGNKERIGGSGDRGVDGFLTTDKFGFERIGVQCKCYSDGKINDDQITKFAHGLKNVNGLNKGIFITTTDYTPSARKVVEESKDIKIILINGSRLAQYMREYQVGVEVIETNFVYDIIIGEEN